MELQLIDRIYECSFIPESWPDVLEQLGHMTESVGACLFISKNDVTAWTASPIAYEATAHFVREGWFNRGQVTARLFAANHNGFLTDLDLFTPDELDREPIYRDMWRPRLGCGWGAATTVPIPTGQRVTFVLLRLIARGPVEQTFIQNLDRLRPHLARSALMSAHLQLERARAASHALASIGLAAVVLDDAGRVLAANALIEAMTDFIQWRAQDRLSLKDKNADQLLRDAVETIDVSGPVGVRSFPVRGADAQALMVAHFVPIRLSARDIFVRCAAMLVLTPLTLPQAPPVELVQSLFDLTPAEAGVARGLASGKTVNDLASSGGVSLNTVRTHVRAVLEKMGCRRQAEVVALLTGISPPRT